MRKRTFVESLNNAAEGFIYVIKHERNMRVHFFFSFLALLFAAFIGVNRVEWMILATIISLVLVTEMINTAIEETMDTFVKEHHRTVRTIKHIGAGAVLVTAVNALVVGFFIFSRYISPGFTLVSQQVRYAPWQTMFLSLLIVVFFVIGGKAFGKHGTPFRGGLVSGHSAVAFSFWAVILFTQDDPFLIGVTFLLSALVAQSRLRARIHSVPEVVLGALVGFCTTALLFKLLTL